MKALWTQEEASYEGQYVSFPPVWSYPKPVQQPHPPVILGGEAKRALKRVVAWGDGWLPRGNFLSVDELAAARKEMDRLASEAGRDPKSLTMTVFRGDPDAASNARYAAAGVDRVLHIVPSLPEAQALAELEALAAAVHPGNN